MGNLEPINNKTKFEIPTDFKDCATYVQVHRNYRNISFTGYTFDYMAFEATDEKGIKIKGRFSKDNQGNPVVELVDDLQITRPKNLLF